MTRYFDRKGQPMELMEWALVYENVEEHRVAEDTVEEQRVSTVWLGLDHRFGEGPPLIFETMIFGGPHGQYQDRYSTEEAALAGHKRTVAALLEGRNPSEG